ncbi:MAG: patatin-like phospholipase family protein [Thermoanaerobaculia bacterium]
MTAGARTGVVLSGGGADGAYEVGVLKALLHGASPSTGYRPIDPEVYTGTSVGAYNAVIMASRPGKPATAVAEELEAIWLDRIANSFRTCGNGVFRVRGAPFQGFDPGCLLHPVRSLVELGKDAAVLTAFGMVKGAQFATSDAPLKSRLLSLVDLDAFVSESPLRQLVAETVDLDSLRRSGKRLTIATSDWEHGVLRLLSKQDITDVVGADGILASTALPGIFRPVTIDGVPYVDGGVLLNTPLKPAIRDGADTLHIVFLDPLVRNITLTVLPSSLDTFYRLFAIIWAANVRRDLLQAEMVNRLIELLDREDLSAVASPEMKRLLRAGPGIFRHLIEGGQPYRKLTIHIYRPATDLGSGEGVLDFQRFRLADLVAMGYRDAVHHDCEAAGCVRPGRTSAQRLREAV